MATNETNLELPESFLPLLKEMMDVKRPLSSVPTFTPQNAFEQWQLYENGSTRRVYFYINGTWRFASLT
jgi:hypothetical protein